MPFNFYLSEKSNAGLISKLVEGLADTTERRALQFLTTVEVLTLWLK